MTHKDLSVPLPDEYFFAPEEVIFALEKFEAISCKHPVNILVAGRQGCGKSSLVRQFAAFYNRPLAVFQMGLLSEPGQLFGEYALKEGETFYREFLFPKAISTPRCVVHLEEINRPEHPKALNELFSVLSENRCIWVDQIGLVEVAPGVIFFATMNEGEEFTGADSLDAALRDRFYIISLDYLPAAVEEKVLRLKAGVGEKDAGLIIRLVQKLRGNPHFPLPVSTRHSLMMAELVAAGTGIREAMIYSLQVSKDVAESVLLSVHAETGDVVAGENRFVPFVPGRGRGS